MAFSLSSKAARDGRTGDLTFLPSITWAASSENEEFLKMLTLEITGLKLRIF